MTDTSGETAVFYKMQGSGNDFVVLDNRETRVPEAEMSGWAERICRRAFGVGADGLFFLDEPGERKDVDYVWHFYNSDGSRAEMCGNGSRCAARLAVKLGLAPAAHAIGTDAGVVRAEVLEDAGEVKVRLTEPADMATDIELEAAGESLAVHFVNTGVPHAVCFVEDVAAVDLPLLGRALRFHERFAPAGTNVNFAQVKGPDAMLLRTYERGVEAETFACGTGACAAVALAHELGLTGPQVRVRTSGGEELTVEVQNGALYLQGGAEIVFTGELNLASQGLEPA